MSIDTYIPIVTGTALFVVLAGFIILFVMQYRKAQLKFQLERQQFQQALLEAEVEMREQTLQEVSRDLHDNFGQIASLIKMNLNMLPQQQKSEEQQRISESIELLKTLIADIRALSRDLAGKNIPDTGLVELIRRDVARVSRAGQIEVKITGLSENLHPDPEVVVFVYRMFQEILNNMIKHSQASHAQVSLQEEGGQLKLQVKDNGKGIPADLLRTSESRTQGSGLRNIRERCRIIGGQCRIESSPAKGTFIEILAPLKEYA